MSNTEPTNVCTTKECAPDFEAELRRLRAEMGCPFGHEGGAA